MLMNKYKRDNTMIKTSKNTMIKSLTKLFTRCFNLISNKHLIFTYFGGLLTFFVHLYLDMN